VAGLDPATAARGLLLYLLFLLLLLLLLLLGQRCGAWSVRRVW
jgi:hypothetical protein